MNKNRHHKFEALALARVLHFLKTALCVYCRQEQFDCSFEFDHVNADKDDTALLPVCRSCNADKSDNSLLDFFCGDAQQVLEVRNLLRYTPTQQEIETAQDLINSTHLDDIRKRNRPMSYNEMRHFNKPEFRHLAPVGCKIRCTLTEFNRYFKTYHDPKNYAVYIKT